MFTDTYLWSLDHSLQPTSHACASRGRCNPIGTVRCRTAGCSVAHTTWQLPCHEPSWASWSICQVCSISTLQAVTSTLVKTLSREPAASWRFFNASDRFTTALASTRHILGSPFCSMTWRTATMCARYSSLFPQEYMGMLRCDVSGSLILKIWGSSLGVTMSITGTYRMGGR
jgi:hypothetical protein